MCFFFLNSFSFLPFRLFVCVFHVERCFGFLVSTFLPICTVCKPNQSLQSRMVFTRRYTGFIFFGQLFLVTFVADLFTNQKCCLKWTNFLNKKYFKCKTHKSIIPIFKFVESEICYMSVEWAKKYREKFLSNENNIHSKCMKTSFHCSRVWNPGHNVFCHSIIKCFGKMWKSHFRHEISISIDISWPQLNAPIEYWMSDFKWWYKFIWVSEWVKEQTWHTIICDNEPHN